MVIPSTPGLPLFLLTRFHALSRFSRSHTSSISRSVKAEFSVADFAMNGSVSRRGFTPVLRFQGQHLLVVLPLSIHEIPVLLALSIVRAFSHRFRLRLSVFSTFRPWSASIALPTARPNTPSADFCPAVRRPRGRLSGPRATPGRSPGVSSIAFGAQPPDLRFASLMDLDFAMCRPLVRRLHFISGFCSSARTFDPRFLQTPPRDGSPCVSLTLHLHQVGWKTFTSELLSMPGTQRTRSAGGRGEAV
ncbi:hypothetical protein ABIB82_007496 [Bradyrhizobium sp. i1.8.4]